MPLRPCARPGCPQLVARGYCDGCKPSSPAALNEKRRLSSHRRGYTREWAAYSRRRLAKHPLCVGYPLGVHGDRVVAAEVTDHIESAATHPELFWVETNHQSLCQDCNKRKAIDLEGGFGVRG